MIIGDEYARNIALGNNQSNNGFKGEDNQQSEAKIDKREKRFTP